MIQADIDDLREANKQALKDSRDKLLDALNSIYELPTGEVKWDEVKKTIQEAEAIKDKEY